MKIVNLNNVEKTKVKMDGVKGVCKQLPIGTMEGSKNFAFRVFTLEIGGNTPYHTHEFEHINYVISGEGVLVDKDKNESPIKTGDFAFINPSEKHQFVNKSADKEFVMICAVPSEYQ